MGKMNDNTFPSRFSRTGLPSLKPSPTLGINERVQELQATGRDVYHLGFGESRFPVHPLIARALQENAQQRSYLPVLGLPALRKAVADYYGQQFELQIDPKQVIIGPGSKALIYAMLVAFNGDIIMPTPAWSSYQDMATLAGRPVVEVLMDAENGYRLDAGRLQAAILAAVDQGRQPDMLLINNPHNPTSTTLSAEEINALARFARDYNLMILSDEIYSFITYDTAPAATLARAYPEGTVILGGLSKQMSLGGWRLGVAILPPTAAGDALRRAIRAIAGCIWSCAAAPVQYAALTAYSGDPQVEAYRRQCTQLYAVRTRYLYEVLVEFGILCPEPTAAFYVYASFAPWRESLAARGIETCGDLSQHLLEKYDIAVLPGSTFGDDPRALVVRFSTSTIDVETDEQAQALVDAFGRCEDEELLMRQYHPRLREVVARLADFVSQL